MYRIFFVLFLTILLNNCSFDNKTGIWTGSDQVEKKKKEDANQNIELVFKKQSTIVEEKELDNQILNLDKPISYKEWRQSFQNKFNNISNVLFLNEGNYKKLSKVSNSLVNKNILVYENNLFFSDQKGNIGVFSLSKNQLIFKYNFYKNKFKKTKKDIKIIIKEDIIIAADNFGYVYSINYKKNKILWAKNFLIPFRSNLKIINGIIFLSDEKNKIVLLDIKNGNKIDELYTQPSKTVSSYESNLAVDDDNNLLFLSTGGSLYSLNLINNKRINWIQNFKLENEIVFNGNPITISKNQIIISTDDSISLLNTNGVRIWNLNIKSKVSPIISGNTIFTINSDNFLVLIDKNSGQIKYSKNLYSILANDFKKSFQRKIKKIDHLFLTDNKLLLISENSYFIEINLKGVVNISSIKKNPFKISSDIIFLINEMIFVDSSKRIYKVN